MTVRRSRTFQVLLTTTLLVGCAASRPVDDIRTSADELYEQGAYAEAAHEYAQIVERYPGDWQGQYKLGRCWLELGEAPDARRALEIAQRSRPHDDDVADALAEAMYEEGDEEQLFAFVYERAQSTGSVRAYRRLAHYSWALHDPDLAQMALETAIVLDGAETVEPYLDAATFHQGLGNADMVRRRLRQAYGIDPFDQRVHDRLRAVGEVPGPTLALPPGK